MNKAKFYLEPKPSPNGEQAINMFSSINKKRFKYYTGIRVRVNDFQINCNSSSTIKPIKSTAPDAAAKNTILLKMAARIATIIAEAKPEELNAEHVRNQLNNVFKPKPEKIEPASIETKESNLTFLALFKKIIDDTENGTRLLNTPSKAGQKFTFNSIKNYRTSLAAVKRCFKHYGIKDLELHQVNKDFYQKFKTYCFDIEEKEISTFAGYVKDIKTVMKESKSDTFNSADFILPSYEADTIYLSLSQLQKLSDLDLSDYTCSIKIDRGDIKENVSYRTLDKVRDLFLIGAYTGLRFSDFSKLDINSIDEKFIKLKQVKTGNKVVIPISPKLHPVLEKYKTGLPTISNQKFNLYIKHVAELAGLTELTEIKSTKGNKQTTYKVPLHRLISSHCCRRSYATNMFNAGVPPMLIMSATGHKSESSFLKYIRATSQDKAMLLGEIMEKLGL